MGSDWKRTVGYVAAGAGLIAVTTGGLLAWSGVNRANDAKERLAAATAANAGEAWDMAKLDYDAAKSRNQLGWTVAGIGAAVLVGGAFLVVTAPDRPSGVGLRATAPWVTSRSGGLVLEGSW